MDAQLKEAISLAAEISKQLMALATGILAVTVTFMINFIRRISVRQLWLLLLAWIGYLFTILFALWHLSALTGNVLARPIDTTLNSAKLPAFLQLVSFGVGTILIVIFAIWMGASVVEAQERRKRITGFGPS